MVITCSKSTIEKLEKDMEDVKRPIKHQNDVVDVVVVFLLLTFTIFYTFFRISFIDFEHVNISWLVPFRTKVCRILEDGETLIQSRLTLNKYRMSLWLTINMISY